MNATLETPALAEILDSRLVTVDAARNRAVVGSTSIESTSPAELRARLSATIYTHLHARNPETQGVQPGRRGDLTQRLVDDLPHRTIVQAAVAAPSDSTDAPLRSIVVGGVKVLVPTEDLVHDDAGSVVGTTLPSWRPSTTPGYLLALGQRGLEPDDRVARLYVACDSAAEALAIWGTVLRSLARAGVRHQAKALSDSRLYPRSDAVVVYVPVEEISTAGAAVAQVLDQHEPGRTRPSIFTERLRDRIACAEEPADLRPEYRGLSFGQHRSRVLAEALIAASLDSTDVRDAWHAGALAAGIDPENPGRNLR